MRISRVLVLVLLMISLIPVSVSATETVDVYVVNKDKTVVPTVTNLYSLNYSNNNLYQPQLDDKVVNEILVREGIAAGNRATYKVNDNSSEIAVGLGFRSTRELEVLGYDFLYRNHTLGKEPQLIEEHPRYKTAVMDIYKALGQEIVEYQNKKPSYEKINLETSPLVAALGGISSVDSSKGRTEIELTRSNVDSYFERSKRELTKVDPNSDASDISRGEFLEILSEAMYLYGEPVMTDQERNILIQVYGAEVPRDYTEEQKEVYLYVKSRGLVDNVINFDDTLTKLEMLTTLMRVKDVESRLSYKELALTIDVNDILVKKGYFKQTLYVAKKYTEPKVEVSYDYGNSTNYDYLIGPIEDLNYPILSEHRPMLSYSGPDDAENWWLSTDDKDFVYPNSSPVEVVKYEGKDYYHFSLDTKEYSDSKPCIHNWFSQMDASVTYNVIEIPDRKGGIYTLSNPVVKGPYGDSSSKVTLQRVSGFDDTTPEYVDAGRVTTDVTSFIDRLLGRSVHAADRGNNKIMNMLLSGISSEAVTAVTGYLRDNDIDYTKKTDSTMGVTVYSIQGVTVADRLKIEDMVNKEYRQGIQLNDMLDKFTEGYMNLEGNLLVSCTDLYNAGILESAEVTVDGGKVSLDSIYGEIVIDLNTQSIYSGQVVYRIPGDNTVLYNEKVMSSSTDEVEHFVDVRVLTGFSVSDDLIVFDESLNAVATGVDKNYIKVDEYTKVKNTEVYVIQNKGLTYFTVPSNSSIPVFEEEGTGDYYIPLELPYTLSNYIVEYAKENDVYNSYLTVLRGGTINTDAPILTDNIYEQGNFTESNLDSTLVEWHSNFGSLLSKNYVYYRFPLNKTSMSFNQHFKVTKQGLLYKVPFGGETLEDAVDTYYEFNDILPFYVVNIKGSEYLVDASISTQEGSVVKFTTSGTGALIKEVSYLEAGMIASNSRDYSLFYSNVKIETINLKGSKCVLKLATGDLLHVSADEKFYRVGKNTYKIFETEVVLDNGETDIDEAVSQEDVEVSEKEDNKSFEAFKKTVIEGDLNERTELLTTLLLQIVPMVLTMMLITLMSFVVLLKNSKTLRLIAEKTIDPVRILTLGLKGYDEFNSPYLIVSVLLGIVIFGIVYSVNSLEPMQKVLEFLDAYLDRY